jgi:transposase InsO family protein
VSPANSTQSLPFAVIPLAFASTMDRLTSAALLTWSVDHDVALHFIDPGKPAQNAWIESFNARVRDEFLNARLFRSAPEMHAAAQEWLIDYNDERPHSSLTYLTPKEFADGPGVHPTPQLSVA